MMFWNWDLCSERRLKEALMLLKEMELSGCARNVVVYNTLIDGLCKNNRVGEAEDIFDQREMSCRESYCRGW